MKQTESRSLTDSEILNAAITAADELDATRVSEMVAGGWKATTIFEGDTGLLRFGRLVEKALLAKLNAAAPSETGDNKAAFQKAWDEAINAAAAVADREWVGQNSLTGSKVARKIADGIRDLRTVEAADV